MRVDIPVGLRQLLATYAMSPMLLLKRTELEALPERFFDDSDKVDADLVFPRD